MSVGVGSYGGPASTVLWSKAVRDLRWALSSPHLLSPCCAAVGALPDEWCRTLVEASYDWLCTLDAEPKPLEDWLLCQPNCRRLGLYYACLLEYWVRFCPALQSAETVLTQQQVHAGLAGAVAGQLKLVFHARGAIRHWESHVKYFVYVPRGDSAPELGANPTGIKSDAGLARFVGPFLGENLLHRVAELRRKLSLSQAPAVRTFLAGRFGAAEAEVRAESAVRGYVFHPLRGRGGFLELRAAEESRAAAGLPDATGGARSGAESRRASPGIAATRAGAPAEGWTGCPAVSSSHARGWWCSSLEELFAESAPDSLFAAPGNGQAPRGALLTGYGYDDGGGKLHWLAPAAARRGADGRVRVGGIPRLGVADCVLMSADELRRSVGGDTLPQGSSAILVLQLERANLTSVGAGGGGGGGEQGGEELYGEEVWLETSRGFLMPPDWRPDSALLGESTSRDVPLGMLQRRGKRRVGARGGAGGEGCEAGLGERLGALAVRGGKEDLYMGGASDEVAGAAVGTGASALEPTEAARRTHELRALCGQPRSRIPSRSSRRSTCQRQPLPRRAAPSRS